MEYSKINKEEKERVIGKNNGHIDSWTKLIIRILIISSLNFVDLILSIISFDHECLVFFILKYITIKLPF